MGGRIKTRTAGVYKRSRDRGDVYEARYRTKDGRQVGRTFPSLEAAEAFLVEQKHRVRSGDYIDKDKANTPWATVADQWLASKKVKGRKERTLRGYRHTLDSWCAPWDDWPIASIGYEDVQALVVMMNDAGKAPQTVRNVFNVVRGVLGYAVKAGYTRTNPALLMSDDLPAQVAAREARYLTAGEVAGLAVELDDVGSLIVRLAAWSGMRAGEIAGLRVRSVDPMRSRVTVSETVVVLKGELRADTPKSRKSNRTVTIPRPLVNELRDYIAAHDLGPEDYVFGEGQSPFNHGRWYVSTFTPAVVRAGLGQLRFHDLRHTYASLMHADGRSMLEVSRWMGHSTYRLTADTYSHLWDDEDGSLADSLGASYLASASAPPPTPLSRIG